MCLADSDKLLLEEEYEDLPLPYKVPSLCHMFLVDPNKDRDVRVKTCRCSLSYPGAKCSAFLPCTFCNFTVFKVKMSSLPENLNTYCTENRIYASSFPRTALPQRSRLFSGSSHICFLLQKAFCEHTGDQLL